MSTARGYDFADARAAVDWAMANLPSLKDRIKTWLDVNVDTEIKKLDGRAAHDWIVLLEKEPLPKSFSVEVGAYINVIRSSLDILACALANRHGIVPLRDVYFPFPRQTGIAGRKQEIVKFIDRLPVPERALFESLQAEEGGNKLLRTLHRLDTTRKHRRLLHVELVPKHFIITGFDVDDSVRVKRGPGGFRRTSDNETVLATIKKGAPKPKINITPQVSFDEADLGAGGNEVSRALCLFVHCAREVIDRFAAL